MVEVKQFNIENISPESVQLFSLSAGGTYDDIKNSYQNVNYVSFDGLGIDLEADSKVFAIEGDYIGIMSSAISEEDCKFATPPTITFTYGSSGTPSRETICFYGDCCKKLKFTVTSDKVSEPQYLEDFSSVAEIRLDIFDNTTPINTLTVEFLETSNPHEAIKIYSITNGSVAIYDEFQSYNLLEEMNILSDDLPINEFDFEVISEKPFVQDQPINVYSNNQYYGTFFVEDCERTAENIYSVTAFNSVKKLDECDYESFNPSNANFIINGFSNVVNEQNVEIKGISQLTGVEITLEPNIYNETETTFIDFRLHGNVQNDTCRYTLCALAYALDMWLDSSRNSGIVFKKLPKKVKSTITADRILGEATLKRQNPISSAIYENVLHEFFSIEENKVIDLKNQTNRTKYLFEKPSIVTSIGNAEYYLGGATFPSDSDFKNLGFLMPVNAMDVKAINPTAENRSVVIVTEYTYRIKSEKIENLNIDEITRVNEVKINPFNLVATEDLSDSTAIAPIHKNNTIKKYISSLGTVSAKIILEDEKVGDLVTIETAFDGEITGIITSMNISFGYINTAEIEVYEWQI